MGNRRRKKFNPKYAALSWNIHNNKKAMEKEKEKEDLAAKLVEEQRLAEMVKQKELARLKLEEDNRKALEVAARLKR